MHRLRRFVPSANFLYCFEAAARRGSFTAAARELNVSQPAVSKTIRLLEESTGLKLFNRRHRGLELTADGQRLYTETQAAFDHLHMVVSSLGKPHSNDVVRVSFSASFVQLWLLPRLSDFKAKHPDVTLRIEESDRDDHDLSKEDIDLSARLGDGKWSGDHAWHFVKEEIAPVCSPDYLRDHGPIEVPADLLQHKLLSFEERHRVRLDWREWLTHYSVPLTQLNQGFIFTDLLHSVEAAVRGYGIALGWKHLIQDQVRSGRLVLPLREIYRSDKAVYLVMATDRPPKRGAEIFRDWLMAQGADDSDFLVRTSFRDSAN